ncbi:transketolase [Sphaerochaeta globosa]|uniref:Transketolase n=1 Tax=Sphaerochaeta globosa (strain ATCC BAA-1886 / DSM 22777 / Buddy) TaxID=158189 RepID=F0RT30_SPHGB|nr:transketolase [Sphaerochaeta globosa]ADY14474.1 transketolase [Sphaerochaeta globosa str. Buddy]
MKTNQLADAIRILSMDGVQKANSGHPGAPMGMADIAEVLWRKIMAHNPKNPQWANRDRFVLSNGHASMLLYSLLHLSGYDLGLDDLKQFRQLHSRTAGHPEYKLTPGVETTTGPLGQGLANAVGMALAEKMLAAQFNKEGFPVVNHYTYTFLGDGCLMEGISHEAASLAGTWKLGKLIAIYDNNGISIDGEVKGWLTDDTAKRFEAYGWQVFKDINGHDSDAIQKVISAARYETSKPTLIMCKTTIGYGSPNKGGKESCHGAPLGSDEVTLARKQLGWEYDEPFFVPEEIYKAWDQTERGGKLEHKWNDLFASYEKAYPAEAAELKRRLNGQFPADWEASFDAVVKQWQADKVKVASRKASQMTLDVLGKLFPELTGGSADLSPSNLTQWKGVQDFDVTTGKGTYLRFGVREFGMTAVLNGMALHGGFLTYGATFLMFMEYARNALRMSALMGLRNVMVFTHDSIGLGEDGPTHQPVEQIASLRMTPNMTTWRPCDAVETACAWKSAVKRTDGPTALLLSRQNLAPQERTETQLAQISKGAYTLYESAAKPQVILIGTGSEVSLALEAGKKLASEGKAVRVVSMPSPEVFERQDAAYKEAVLPASVKARVAVEAAWTDFWYKYVGLDGKVIGMHSFGESGPAEKLYEFFGITAVKVYEAAASLL